MNLIPQSLTMLRTKADRPMPAKPFSSLSAHKSNKHYERLGALLGSRTRSSARPKGRRGARR